MKIYCDTSAIIKRYVREEHSDIVRNWFETDHDFYTLTDITDLEAHSALDRLLREESTEPLLTFAQDLRKFHRIEITKSVCSKAKSVVELAHCKALDSLHVGAALSIGKGTRWLPFIHFLLSG